MIYLSYAPTSCICVDIEEHHLSLKNENLLFKNAYALQNPFDDVFAWKIEEKDTVWEFVHKLNLLFHYGSRFIIQSFRFESVVLSRVESLHIRSMFSFPFHHSFYVKHVPVPEGKLVWLMFICFCVKKRRDRERYSMRVHSFVHS